MTMAVKRPKAGRILRWGAIMLCAAIPAAPPACAEAPHLPALVEPASSEHHPGKIVFVQLVTPDLATAKPFYAGLFGWTFHDGQFGSTLYADATLENRLVAGLVQRPLQQNEQRQPLWLGFFSTRDVDATAKAAVQQGGKVLFEPHDIPDLGREAVLEDPQGAVFAVLASGSGDPPDYLAGAGEWIWSSLITPGPDSAAAFYQTLLGYDVFEAEPDAAHLIVSSDNYARASVNGMPGKADHGHPHWLNFVRVADAEAAAAKAVSLGGKVLVKVHPDRDGNMIAVLADPLGAPFGVLEWPESDSKVIGR
jgi:hypothetical protein